MAGVALDYRYSYPFASSVERAGDKVALCLAADRKPQGEEWFVRALLRAPRRTAELLLGIGEVARTRFFIPATMLERIISLADPVVTSGHERVRFESFSACCGVYARLDLLPDALDTPKLGAGTTNVDMGTAMRGALAHITDDERVMLSVGASRMEIEREGEHAVERQVALPLRWLKGFVEVQATQARMHSVLEIDGVEARRFLRALPRQRTGSQPTWVEPSGRGLRLAFRKSAGAVPLVGIERVRLLESLARQASKLRLHSDGAASAWELSFPDARFVLVLSPEPSRGFSGEGRVLDALAADSEGAVATVRAALTWQSRLDETAIAAKLSLPPTTVSAALAALGTRGLVGFDLADGGYFHRPLPFDLALVEGLHPRLVAARKLVEQGAVELIASTGEARVTSGQVVHRVRPGDDGPICTCPWYAKHRNERGPCKHMMAATLASESHDPK